MELGLFTCGYQRLDLETAFCDARKFEYDYVELWGGYPHACVLDMNPARIKEIKVLAKRYEMPVKCYTPEHNGYPYNYMAGDMEQWDRCMQYLENAIAVTAALEVPYMLFSAGHAGINTSENEIDERLKISIQRLVSKAEEQDVTLILEPLTKYESNAVTDLKSLKRALSYSGSDHLIGMCDLAVPHTNGENAADYVSELGQRFGYLHLIDNDGISDSHILPGDGNIPLKKVLSDIRENGFDGPATIELVTAYMDDPSYYAGLAIERAKEIL